MNTEAENAVVSTAAEPVTVETPAVANPVNSHPLAFLYVIFAWIFAIGSLYVMEYTRYRSYGYGIAAIAGLLMLRYLCVYFGFGRAMLSLLYVFFFISVTLVTMGIIPIMIYQKLSTYASMPLMIVFSLITGLVLNLILSSKFLNALTNK